MKIFSKIMIFLVGVVHVMFFKLESLDLKNPDVMLKFGLDDQSVVHVAPWAFNQGFYNLFLALGLFYSLFLYYRNKKVQADTLASFILATIVGAAAVLHFSIDGKLAAALVQGAPAFLGFVSICFINDQKS